MAEKKGITAQNAPGVIGPYSQGVRCGSLVFCSGQLGVSPQDGRFVSDSVGEQTQQALQNLQAILASEDCKMNDILKATIYLKNMDDFPIVNKIYGTFFTPPYPARATVEVSRLPLGALVEIDAIAQRP